MMNVLKNLEIHSSPYFEIRWQFGHCLLTNRNTLYLDMVFERVGVAGHLHEDVGRSLALPQCGHMAEVTFEGACLFHCCLANPRHRTYVLQWGKEAVPPRQARVIGQ